MLPCAAGMFIIERLNRYLCCSISAEYLQDLKDSGNLSPDVHVDGGSQRFGWRKACRLLHR